MNVFFLAEEVVSDIRAIQSSGSPKKIKFSDGNTIVVDPTTATIIVKYLNSIDIPAKRKMAERLNNNLVDFMNVLDDAYTNIYG